MNGGGGHSHAPSAPPPPIAEIVKPLPLTLEEMHQGGTKRMKVTRNLYPSGSESKVLEIVHKPGWKKGTKIKFTGAGHEDAHGQSQTVAFVVEEKKHDRFIREEDDAVIRLNVSLVDALTGPGKDGVAKREILHLNGKKIEVKLPTGVSISLSVLSLRSTSADGTLLYSHHFRSSNPTKKLDWQVKVSPSTRKTLRKSLVTSLSDGTSSFPPPSHRHKRPS